jgi:hypothetical protein
MILWRTGVGTRHFNDRISTCRGDCNLLAEMRTDSEAGYSGEACEIPSGKPFQRMWLVGFAGHRRVVNPVIAKASIHRELEGMIASLKGEVVGVSSAAAGADLLFLEVCAELDLKTVVILPFACQRFAEDFEDPAEWARARRLIDAAWWSETAAGGEEAPAAYHVVSRDLLELADHMIFLWDGAQPRGLGGTAEAVREAGERGISARIIDAESHDVRWLSGIAPEERPQRDLSRLPAACSVRDLFLKLDQRALTTAPKSRWFNAGSMSVNHVATFFLASIVALNLPREMGGFTRFGLAVVAAALPWVGSRARLQERWVSDRVAAELLRSLLACHDAASPLRPQGVDHFGENASLLRSAALQLVPERRSWQMLRSDYLDSRLDDQIKYLRGKHEGAAGRLRFFKALFHLSSGGAILFGGLLMATHLLNLEVRHEWREWLFFFLPMVLPGVAAWSLAMISVFEFKRRAELYGHLVDELESLRPKLVAAKCGSAVINAIRQCERLLLSELWEWQGPHRS